MVKKVSAAATTAIYSTDAEDLMVPGSVIPVAPGRMRNILYPFQKAAYVSKEQLRDLKRQEYPIERDYTYGMEKSGDVEESSAEGDERSLLNVQMDLLSVLRSISLHKLDN